MEREEIQELLGFLGRDVRDIGSRIGTKNTDIDKLKILSEKLEMDKMALDIYINILARME